MPIILDYTQEKYGSYHLNFLKKEVSTARAVQDLIDGERAHVNFLSNVSYIREDSRILIPIPLYQGILGLRKCIIRKGDEARFNMIDTPSLFKNVRIGQGKFWPDVEIYESAKLKVVGSLNYTNLFPMLAAKRFDCLPLSIVEVDEALADKAKFKDRFTISNGLYIFYPIPVYIAVSRYYTRLAERIKFGLMASQKNKDIELLFEKYFRQYIEATEHENARVFILNNPLLSKQENKTITKFAIDNYFAKSSQIFYLPIDKDYRENSPSLGSTFLF